jgi:hypothetical protein
MQAWMRLADRIIIGSGDPVGPVPDPDTMWTVALRDDQRAKLEEPGLKRIEEDGTITVIPPDPATSGPIPGLQQPTQTNAQLAEGAVTLATVLEDSNAPPEEKDQTVTVAISALASTLTDPNATREQKDIATAASLSAIGGIVNAGGVTPEVRHAMVADALRSMATTLTGQAPT